MLSGRWVLLALRWLALLTIAFAFIDTGLALYLRLRDYEWSIRHDTTHRLHGMIGVLQDKGYLILQAALLWVLTLIAERLPEVVERNRGTK